MKDNSTAQHPLAKMTRQDEELGLYDDGARVPYAGLEGAEDWEVGPCVNHLGNVTSWDICVPREPDVTGVVVVASVYSGEKVARAILAAIKDNISTEALTRAPVSQDAEQLVERLRRKATWDDFDPATRDDFSEAADLIEALTRVQPSTGFDPSRIAEVISQVEPSLLAPIINRAADEFYNTVLGTAEDYFRDNLDWNLKSHLAMLERENQRMRTELYEVDRKLGGDPLGHKSRIESIGKLQDASNAYHQLVWQVSKKFEGETRHETALRYIKEREAVSPETHQGDSTK